MMTVKLGEERRLFHFGQEGRLLLPQKVMEPVAGVKMLFPSGFYLCG
jgi:hypothetical protein